MKIDIDETDNYVIVKVSGKLDAINAPEFTKLLQEILDKKASSCLLNMSDVSFLSSSGLQSFLTGAKVSKKNDTGFYIFGMQEMVQDVFEMSGFNQFIKSFASKEEALANL